MYFFCLSVIYLIPNLILEAVAVVAPKSHVMIYILLSPLNYEAWAASLSPNILNLDFKISKSLYIL